MILHPKIQGLYEAAREALSSNVLNIDMLKHFKVMGATQTEASITLHMGFNVPLEEAEDFVYQSGIWEPEEINDIAYQTFTYLYYNQKD